VDDRQELAFDSRLARRPGLGGHGDLLDGTLTASCGHGIGPQRDPVGHAIQPASQRTGGLQPAGFSEEHQKRGLEGIFGVALIPEHAPADRQDHRAVPRDQGSKRPLVAPVEKAFHELGIGQAGERPYPV
jgi:hypothetical protein